MGYYLEVKSAKTITCILIICDANNLVTVHLNGSIMRDSGDVLNEP